MMMTVECRENDQLLGEGGGVRRKIRATGKKISLKKILRILILQEKKHQNFYLVILR